MDIELENVIQDEVINPGDDNGVTNSTIDASPMLLSSKPGDATNEPTDEAVLSYLRKKGLSNAAMELSKLLRTTEPTRREALNMDEEEAKSQRTILSQATGGGFGYDVDSGAQISQWGFPDKVGVAKKTMGMDEASAFVDSFVALQTWVFGLPDTDGSIMVSQPKTGISLQSIFPSQGDSSKDLNQRSNKRVKAIPSSKYELLSVTFSLLVHTYCELLEVGMEYTAHTLLRTFRSVYEPHYNRELGDLDKCSTTEDMVRLNTHNSSYLHALANLKSTMIQLASFQIKKDELTADNSANNQNSQHAAEKKRRLAGYSHNIANLNQRYDETAKVATQAFEKMQDYPFLRRARAVRWQLTLSAASYSLLASFLSSQESLLPMNTLLLKQCEIQLEHRDPLPYLPDCILDDNAIGSRKRALVEGEIQWAAPIRNRHLEAGEETSDAESLQDLPFPSFYIKEEYNSRKDGFRDKGRVEFNRSILLNGFRKLEAIERKNNYDVGIVPVTTAEAARDAFINPLEPSILLSTLCSSSSPGPHLSQGRAVDAAAIWEEPGIGLTCARLCPPDGRRVAAGCDDAAVRIWSVLDDQQSKSKKKDTVDAKKGVVQETSIVFLGHKNGFPVFDVSWNRDGRTLLSAGGDGSIRLWDTMAKGTFGRVAKINAESKRSILSHATSATGVTDNDPGMPVPGSLPEPNEEINGAALAVYRGHSPQCPIWSVAFSPSGYYFASAAADGTGRVWVTDRPTPIRILTGHTNASVNAITWHPNVNYLATGSDDKTVRLWDVHTGRCVRLLNGCSNGVNCVAISPSGRYAAASDYGGVVHLWDLGSGKKLRELRTDTSHMIHSLSYSSCGTALAAGGNDCVVRIWDIRGAGSSQSQSVLETSKTPTPKQVTRPHHAFLTRRTVIMDLQYNKRNLLLAVGKYTTPVPLITPISD
jgi:WD40 repeat protein